MAFITSMEWIGLEKGFQMGLFAKGFTLGFTKGWEKGFEQGKKNTPTIVKRMLEEEFDLPMIQRLTGLSYEELLSLARIYDTT